MTTQSWKDKWARIDSKFKTCTNECIIRYRSDDRCRDSIKSVIADIWSLKDWLFNDSATGIQRADINAFLETPQAFNIRACGDIETHNKHLRVDDQHRENTTLILKGIHKHPSGRPVIFGVTRIYKSNPNDQDHWEDAWELARRAIEEWKWFLTAREFALVSRTFLIVTR